VNPQHLSDEAVAAFADGVLTGHARERATRHIDGCTECRQAVKVQREAVLALRAAAAPTLPGGLLDRLRSVPLTTPINTVPTAIGPDGSPMLATFAPMAALVPAQPVRSGHRARPFVAGAAVMALAGALAASSAVDQTTTAHGSTGRYVNSVDTGPGPGLGQPAVTDYRFGRP
jgi:anti-sigma factor RsiW